MNLQTKKLMKLQANEATKGFTLIELLVVIAIIGLLSSIVLASLGTARSKAADAVIQENITGIRASAEIYYQSSFDSYQGRRLSGTNPTNFNSTQCPNTLCSPNPSATCHMFQGNNVRVPAANQIYTAIKESLTLTSVSPSFSSWCAADAISYGIAVALKTQDDPDDDTTTNDYFCIDNSGVAKIIDEWGNPFGAGSPYRCP